jgi:hypothetical protein
MQKTDLFRLAAENATRQDVPAFDAREEFVDFVLHLVDFPLEARELAAENAAKSKEELTQIDIAMHGIDLRLFCSKTGQPLGNLDAFPVQLLIATKGIAVAKETIEAEKAKTVAKGWLWTGPEQLELLSQLDPLGYFVYSASAAWPYMVDKVRVYANLRAMSMQLHDSEVIVYNDILRRFLSIVPSQCERFPFEAKFSHPSLEAATASKADLEKFCEDLRQNILSYVTKAVRRGVIKGKVTYADVVTLKDVRRPQTAFRMQAKPRNETEAEFVARTMQEFLPQENLAVLTGGGPSTAELKAIKRRLRERNQILVLDPNQGVNLKVSTAVAEAESFFNAAVSGESLSLVAPASKTEAPKTSTLLGALLLKNLKR